MSALEANCTWELVTLPFEKVVVGCSWVFNVKVGHNGNVGQLKVRLIEKGNTQVYGQDYSDTFSQVAKMAYVRLFLAMATMKHLFQLNIKNGHEAGDLYVVTSWVCRSSGV